MPTLYSLIVSVSNYPNPAHRLPGCANDFETMVGLLEKQAALHQLDYCPLTLLDEQATREGIITAFDHFAQAKKDDVCIFYFSGHGSYVAVEDIFYNNSSGRNESLVCFDSRTTGGRDLMDKELAYLAHRAMHKGQARFISILDCCHSGSAFRSDLAEATTAYAKERQTSPSGYVSPKDYLGFNEYECIEGKRRPIPYPALHLSACQPHERAREINLGGRPQGIFTYCLNRELSIVNPSISVGELMNRINFLAHTLNAKQFPELESDRATWRDQPLLGPTINNQSQSFFTRNFQAGFRNGEWTLNAGAQQGIQAGNTEHPTTFVDEEGCEWQLNKLAATTASVFRTDGDSVNDKIYSLKLVDNGPDRLRIGFHPDLPKKWKTLFLAEAHNYPSLLLVEDACESTAYRIDPLVDEAILVRPNEGYPLFERQEIFGGEYGVNAVNSFLSKVQSIAAWEAVLALNNPDTKIEDGDISIEITVDDGNEKPLIIDAFGKEVPLNYYPDEAGTYIEPAYRIKIKNTSNHHYFLSAIYAGSDFWITNELLEKQTIAPGGELFLGTTEADPWLYADFKSAYSSWGVTEIIDRIRLVISRSEQLNTNGFNQEALPLDTKKTYKNEGNDRGFKRARSKPNQKDWTVKTIPLRIIRPLDTTAINEHGNTSIQGLKIDAAPAGFEAKATLGTLVTGNRSVKAPLPSVLSEQPILLLNSMGNERNLSDQLNVLELTEVRGKDQISESSPLKVRPEIQLSKDEYIIPFGYDPESRFYYPLGTSDEHGNVLIEDLPPEVAEERSLGGSIKIFFQKIVGQKVGIPLDYPLVRRVKEDASGTIVYTDEDMEAIKAHIDQEQVKDVVIFIHGIIGDTTTSTALIQSIAKLKNEKFDDQFQAVLTFDYENLNTNIDQTAKELKKKLTALGFGQNGKRLFIFAHSMGGLVSRWMIEKEGGDKIVHELYTFGTPHNGSPWSNVAEMFTSAITYAINGATISNFWLAPLLGLSKLWKATQVTLGDMQPGGSFIKRINDGAEAPIPYTLIAGNTQLIRAMSNERTQSFIKRIIYRFRKQPHYALLDLALFKAANDIAVSLASQQEVRGDMVRKPDPLPCDHLSYFGNEECTALVKKLLAER